MFDWITSLVEKSGYLGIAFLMFAENVFPPIPSEIIMPLAGFTAARAISTRSSCSWREQSAPSPAP